LALAIPQYDLGVKHPDGLSRAQTKLRQNRFRSLFDVGADSAMHCCGLHCENVAQKCNTASIYFPTSAMTYPYLLLAHFLRKQEM